MTHLAVVPPGAPEPGGPSGRLALSDHMGRIVAARQWVEALEARWDQLRAHVDRAAAARAELASAKEAAAAVMRSWAHQPHDGLPFIDSDAIERRELELVHYEREAEVSRGAQSVLSERSTAATRELATLQSQLPALANAVMLEEAAALRSQLDATIALANEQSAILFGLRSYLTERQEYEAAQAVPVTHEMWPSQATIKSAHQRWHDYAARLSTDPSAMMEN